MNNAANPVAKSPIAQMPPTVVSNGWEISRRRSDKELRLSDWTSLSKILVKGGADGSIFGDHPTPFGRARRLGPNELEVGSDPGSWLLIGPNTSSLVQPTNGGGASSDLTSVIDITHGRALLRLSGGNSARLLEKICAIDLDDSVTPNLTAFRSIVGNVVTDVVRDDLSDGIRSYLLHCDRSSGQYLFDCVLDAGVEFDIDIDGFQL